MKLVVNTVLDPHFIALFDEHDILIDQDIWTVHRNDGARMMDFLRRHHDVKYTFLGGCSGPGGFSSLRACSAFLHALAMRYDVPIHQVRADAWVQQALISVEQPAAAFVLRSFGQQGWTLVEGDLVVQPLESLQAMYANTPVWCAALPEAQREAFPHHVEIPHDTLITSLLTSLAPGNPHTAFTPWYGVPAV